MKKGDGWCLGGNRLANSDPRSLTGMSSTAPVTKQWDRLIVITKDWKRIKSARLGAA
jgi:hypothetical protein